MGTGRSRQALAPVPSQLHIQTDGAGAPFGVPRPLPRALSRSGVGHVQEPQSVKSDINLQRDTVGLVAGENPLQAVLRGVIDCNVRTRISVHSHVSIAASGSMTSRSGPLCSAILEPGTQHNWIQPADSAISLSQFIPHELLCGPADSVFPVAIQLEAIDSTGAPLVPAQIQLTCVTFDRSTSTSLYSVRVIRQQITLGDVAYVMQEIYGLDPRSAEAECVACISEPRDVMVLPCRHLCLCRTCAETLRSRSNKCPMCRGVVQSLLQVQIQAPITTDQPAADRTSTTDASDSAAAAATAAGGAVAFIPVVTEGGAESVAVAITEPDTAAAVAATDSAPTENA